MVVLWTTAAAGAAWIQQARPEQVPVLVALYLCGGFFAHFYALLFMAGSRVRRIGFALIVTAIFGLLIVHHADEMPGRRVVTAGHWVELPTRPAWMVPILCDVAFLLLLWMHALWLGFGTRPKPGWKSAAEPAQADTPPGMVEDESEVGAAVEESNTADESEPTPGQSAVAGELAPTPEHPAVADEPGPTPEQAAVADESRPTAAGPSLRPTELMTPDT